MTATASLNRFGKSLFQQIAEGDENAFKILFDTYRNRLFYYISKVVKSDQAAEELVMDVFIKIWMGRELVMQIEDFDAFLFRVAHNKTIDFFRSAAKDARLRELLRERIQIEETTQADTSLLVQEYEEKIREAIALLSPQRRKVYQLSRQQELSHDQIAMQLHISKSTVNNHIVESQRFIRNYLSKNFDLAYMLLLICMF